MFEKLKDFKRIGWDVDQTLIDHPKSPLMWDFIRANPYGQEHVIVTFRSHGYEQFVFQHLIDRGSVLTQDDFAGFLSVPAEIWEDFHHPAMHFDDIPNNPPRLIASLDEVADHPYLHWKGMICATNSIDVLVDDSTLHVENGCRAHGVPLIHPDDLS